MRDSGVGVGGEELRPPAGLASRPFHPVPESNGFPRIVAGLGHEQDADVVGLARAAPLALSPVPRTR